MRLAACLCGTLIFFSSGPRAAEAGPPATEAEPAVRTSPAADDPQVGRGNPRVRQVLPGAEAAQAPAPVAPAAPSADPPAAPPRDTAAPGVRGSVDRVELSATQITGNSELPRVMYVVPWKRPELGDPGGRPQKSLLDEVLEPVDRDVFRRQNRYYEALQPDAGRAAPTEK